MSLVLRMFQSYKDLEQMLVAAESARIKAEDEVRFWRGRADWAESDRDRARMDLAGALKAISNWQAMMTGAPAVPFPEVAAPQTQQAAPEYKPARSEVRSLRDLQQEAVAKSRKAAFERRQALNDATSNS